MGLGRLIADLVTGGDYSALKKENDRIVSDRLDRISLRASELRERATLTMALNDIAALETPSANATVRKMARIAREATK